MKEYRTERGVFYQKDCMEGMAQYPDKYFDIAIVDPPYGLNNLMQSGGNAKNKKIKTRIELSKWDVKPDKIYFNELFRISKNQIIWGGNYFVDNLPISRGWIVWDKKQPEGIRLSKAELAFTSFNINTEIYRYFTAMQLDKIHVCQKPIALYKWIVKNYVKQGQRILDTHVGSASSLIAYEDAGLEYVGYELDTDYYEAAVKRIKDHREQLTFLPKGIA